MNYLPINLACKPATQLVTCIAILLVTQVAPLSNAAQLDEEDEFRAGLIARYSDGDGNSIERIDTRVSFVWNADTPDPRIGAKNFNAAWSGFLMTQSRGDYVLSVYAVGKVRMMLGGEVILDKQTDTPAWLDAKAVLLTFDWHPLEIQFAKTASEARISLFWKGPGFQLEPIGERWLYHDREKSPSQGFQKGQTLARALRCGACHTVPGQPEALPAPALDRLAGNVSSKWLVDWLSEDKTDRDVKGSGQEDRSLSRRMPHFGLSREDAECISRYLFYQSNTSDKTKPVKDKTNGKTDLKAGKTLLLTTGCLACHQFEGLGTNGLFDGGDLTGIADKRPKEFFATWLSAPEKLNRRHRMPVFSLTTQERHNLTEFLATCKSKDTNDFAPPKLRENDPSVAKGRQLVAKHRCNSCHDIGSDPLRTDAIKLVKIDENADWKQSCTASDGQKPGQPRYRLDVSSRTDLETYFAALNRAALAKPNIVAARQLLVENNCLACHARGADEGLSSQVLDVAQAHRQFESIVPAMIPPSLNSVGDKLHDKALSEVIGRQGGVHRPWLNVRMPSFALSDDELKRLVQHFVDMDRIPEVAARPTLAKPSDAELQLAGARLVTAAGFGCTSCHRVGEAEPPAAPLNTRGPDLSHLGKRIRREWYDRWVRDPARIVPKMEMPSVQLAVRGVLDDQLAEQLDAVWHALNQPGFQPPTPNPVRVVRRSGLSDRNESAAILTDVIQTQGQTFVKPFVVGLRNRHNIMLDLATNRLAGWWIGDVARQRTKGKTWFWESGGTELFDAAPPTTELKLEFGGRLINPQPNGQFFTEADQWRQISAGVELLQRIRFQLPGQLRERTATLHVTQQFQNLPPELESSGFMRTILLGDVPANASPIIQIVDESQLAKNSIAGDKRSVELTSQSRIAITKPESATFTDAGTIELGASTASGVLELVLRYETTLPVDKFPVEAPRIPSPPPEELAVIPGFEATRLPIANQWMPTGLAWRPDGTLVVTSLKGRVWLARDSDGDGLEDEVTPFSDDLAAPYGVAAYEDHIDVVNKYALLRLFDEDGDGRADRTVTVASGWGHTTDYHDWVVGLPRDEAGNYYIAIPCQQDDRSEAAAYLHGKVISLIERSPTTDDPRIFSLKPISGGHRFPMGLARQRDGELFVTDNQGNYNPFNELNHVQLGARYGFINRLERKDGFAPELTPPAINIPHPWTRSVNGICFLYTPEQVKERTGQIQFGPFEGHLIGCEYDTRRLIRMSLQKVGNTYQGAAYPFSFDKPNEGPPLLGPLTCAVAPTGDLYVGSIRDSGWGGANNVGSIVRIKPLVGKVPPGIAEVRAHGDGFVIDFTTAVDVERAMSKSSYSVSSYTRVSTPAYGGSDKDRRSETIHKIEMANDGRGVRLHLNELRAGFVYEFRLKNLAPGEDLFFPDEAFYTLNQIPQ